MSCEKSWWVTTADWAPSDLRKIRQVGGRGTSFCGNPPKHPHDVSFWVMCAVPEGAMEACFIFREPKSLKWLRGNVYKGDWKPWKGTPGNHEQRVGVLAKFGGNGWDYSQQGRRKGKCSGVLGSRRLASAH